MSTFTGHLSLVNGYAFLTDASVDLRPFAGQLITISDGTNTIQAYVGGQSGAGETYQSNLLSSFTSTGGTKYDTFTTSGANITSAINITAHNGYANSGALTLTIGALYLNVITFTLNSGSAPYIMWASNGATPPSPTDFSVLLANGANNIYATFNHASYNYEWIYQNSITNWSSVNVNKQVLTPSNGITSGTYGCWLEATSGGTSHILATPNSSFLPNSATFILTIKYVQHVTGGEIVGGSANVTCEESQSTNKGIVLGGAVTESQLHHYVQSVVGGGICGGAIIALRREAQAIVGGIFCGGSGTIKCKESQLVSKGTVLGGSVSLKIGSKVYASDGNVIGGEVSTKNTYVQHYIQSITGGFVCGGIAHMTVLGAYGVSLIAEFELLSPSIKVVMI